MAHSKAIAINKKEHNLERFTSDLNVAMERNVSLVISR